MGESEERFRSVTKEAIHLIQSLVTDREMRLSCRTYRDNDIQHRGRSGRPLRYPTHSAYFVCANDAEDIKAHEFFHGINWETMHLSQPPWMPQVEEGQDIAKYFDDEDIILSTSQELSSLPNEAESLITQKQSASSTPATSSSAIPTRTNNQKVVVVQQSGSETRALLSRYNQHPSTQKLPDFPTNGKPPLPSSSPKQVDTASDLLVKKKRKEKERPHDKILRDPAAAHTAMEVRKRAAFLGYTYRRCELPDLSNQDGKEEEALRRKIVRGSIPWEFAYGGGCIVGEQEVTT